MTEHDGLTAEHFDLGLNAQLGGWRCACGVREPTHHAVLEHLCEVWKARAEAAEARVAELESALSEALMAVTEDVWPEEGPILTKSHWQVSIDRWRALTTPTTEAVTEVEGS